MYNFSVSNPSWGLRTYGFAVHQDSCVRASSQGLMDVGMDSYRSETASMNNLFTFQSGGRVKALLFLLLAQLVYGQVNKPVTSKDLLQMKAAGLDNQTIIQAIEANGASINSSVESLVELKKAGIDDAVIRAALSAQEPRTSNHGDSKKPVADRVSDEIRISVAEDDSLRPPPIGKHPNAVNESDPSYGDWRVGHDKGERLGGWRQKFTSTDGAIGHSCCALSHRNKCGRPPNLRP